jgi:hypothetical protein
MKRLRWWTVVSPAYGRVVPVTAWGEGPMEYERDVVYVQARDKSEAKVQGLATMRLLCSRGWVADADDGWSNPLAGEWEVHRGKL